MADITFRYNRAPTGELSGESLVSQTEQALSEIVGESSHAEEEAARAVQIATAAEGKADQAVATAGQAQTTANGALTTAQSAQSTASKATQTAQSAVTTARGASQTAQNAVSTAQGAVTAAQSAQTAAENAESRASTSASAAEGSANSASAAQTAAETAQTNADNAAALATQAQDAAAQSAQSAQYAADQSAQYAQNSVRVDISQSFTDAQKLQGQTNLGLIDLIKQILLAAHPVGSYYWSSEATDPGTLFGGTWEQIKDRFVYAVGDGSAAGDTGGEETHTLTVDEMPAHRHNPGVVIYNGGKDGPEANRVSWMTHGPDNLMSHFATVGGGKAHNNMPPYVTAFCWRRTA